MLLASLKIAMGVFFYHWCRGAVHKPVRRPGERHGLINRAPTVLSNVN